MGEELVRQKRLDRYTTLPPLVMPIPIVDLADLGLHGDREPSAATVERVVKELDDAFSTVGFVYLKNHGIERQLVCERLVPLFCRVEEVS